MMKESASKVEIISMITKRFLLIPDRNKEYQRAIEKIHGKENYLILAKLPKRKALCNGYYEEPIQRMYLSDGERHYKMESENQEGILLSSLFYFLNEAERTNIDSLSHYDFYEISPIENEVIKTEIDPTVIEYSVWRIDQLMLKEEIREMYQRAESYITKEILKEKNSKIALAKLGMYEYLSKYLQDEK